MKEIEEIIEKDSYLDTFCVLLNTFLKQHPETKDLWDDILYGTITPLGMLTHLYKKSRKHTSYRIRSI